MNNNNNDIIILDSGASCHMFNSNELMTEYRNVKYGSLRITGFNGNTESAVGIGNIGILRDVLYIPNIPTNILSTTALCSRGFNLIQSRTKLDISNEMGVIIIIGVFYGKLLTIRSNDLRNITNMDNEVKLATKSKDYPLSLLHYKYNHISAERLRCLCKWNTFPGVNLHR